MVNLAVLVEKPKYQQYQQIQQTSDSNENRKVLAPWCCVSVKILKLTFRFDDLNLVDATKTCGRKRVNIDSTWVERTNRIEQQFTVLPPIVY